MKKLLIILLSLTSCKGYQLSQCKAVVTGFKNGLPITKAIEKPKPLTLKIGDTLVWIGKTRKLFCA